jgi:capsular polysaccharide transport system permease protein
MKEPERAELQENTLSFLDLIGALVKHRWFIIGFCGGITLLVFAFFLITKLLPTDSPLNRYPDYYLPTVRVLIREGSQSNPLASALNQSGLGSLSGILGVTTSGGISLAKLAESLLKDANIISDAVASEFGFTEKYGLSELAKTRERSKFKSALTIESDEETGVLKIGYRDINAAFATRVVNRTVELLEEQFRSLTLDRVLRKKRYIEESIASVEAEYKKASSELTAFQTKYGFLDFSQVSESVRQIASLQSQIISKQLSIALLQGSVPENDPRIVQYRNEIAQMQRLIDEMKGGPKDFSLGVVAANQVPELSVQYLALQRDVQIQQSLLATLKQQYEAAKIEEMDTSQTFQVIEKAEIPETKAGPGRARMIVFVALGTFLIASLIAFLMEYFERAGRDPVESEKLRYIRETLQRPFRRAGR